MDVTLTSFAVINSWIIEACFVASSHVSLIIIVLPFHSLTALLFDVLILSHVYGERKPSPPNEQSKLLTSGISPGETKAPGLDSGEVGVLGEGLAQIGADVKSGIFIRERW